MEYHDYLTKYNRLLAQLKRKGLIYAAKVFWQLTEAQCAKYAKVQLANMRKAYRQLNKAWRQDV